LIADIFRVIFIVTLVLSKHVRKVMSKQVREDEKFTGADTNIFSTERGLELSGELSAVKNTK